MSGRVNRSFVGTIAALAALGLVAAGCSSSQTSGATGASKAVSIGNIEALSGSNASAGLDTQRGVELAAQIINEAHPEIPLPFAATTGLPRLGGAKIQLVKKDSQGSPQTAANAVQQLVTSDNVAAVVCCYASAVTEAASAQGERLGVPFVNGASSAVGLTQRGLKWFFRTQPSDAIFAQGMFDLLDAQAKAGKPVKNVAIIHTNDTYGNGAEAVTKQQAEKSGYRVVADVAYQAGATDLTPEVLQIRSANPDVVFAASYTQDGILLMKTLKQLNYAPQAILGYGGGFTDPTFIPTLDKDASGVISRSAWAQDAAVNKVASTAVAKMFQDKYGRPMTEHSAASFTAMMTVADAINTAASTDPTKVRSALESLDVAANDTIMPWKGVKFDGDHQNAKAVGVEEQVIDGSYRVVYPPESANAQLTWPLR